ncbi:MAG: hypothetical protein KKC76_08250 [Proteobacteria bacterium]|nr:hypothetical protein [Pseudomonadota bacterium]MBU4298078.1 hypothetical protein [Pseudomonadota bacterium]MCG2746313.1 hypothetical protein [Desulfobulbaceae bacterium]
MVKKKKIEKKSGRTVFIATAVALIIGIFIFWAARLGSNRWEVPDYLVGRWISSAPDYQDKYLEINNVSLIFATGPGTVAGYFITDITSIAKGKEIAFTFECKDVQGIAYQFFLNYQPDNGGTLFFKNQPQNKWKKEPS